MPAYEAESELLRAVIPVESREAGWDPESRSSNGLWNLLRRCSGWWACRTTASAGM